MFDLKNIDDFSVQKIVEDAIQNPHNYVLKP